MVGQSNDTSLASGWSQWDGDPQEVILAQDPTVNVRYSVIVKDVNPAAITRHGCSEVLQKSLRSHCDIAD